jgi:hypothetical protein
MWACSANSRKNILKPFRAKGVITMEKTVKNRTMAVVLEELNTSVDKYNNESDAIERANLASKHKELVQEFNELSLLNAYAEFMKDEHPVIALAKAYYYDTVSVKDNVHNEVVNGVKTSTVTRSVNDGNKKLDVAKFIEWTCERNKCVAADKGWKAEIGAARSSIEKEWKRFFASKSDKKDISIGSVKKATQKAFDALVFIPCENNKDKNAVIANGDVAKMLIAFANKLQDSKNDGKIDIKGTILPVQTWNALLLTALHLVVENKKYEVVYGTEEEAAKAAAKVKAEAEPETEAEAEAEA